VRAVRNRRVKGGVGGCFARACGKPGGLGESRACWVARASTRPAGRAKELGSLRPAGRC